MPQIVKVLLILTLLFPSLNHWAMGQENDWKGLHMPEDFSREPYNFTRYFYVDTEEDVLYISGHLRLQSDYKALVLKWDGSRLTTLPVTGQIVTGPMMKYKGQLYVGGDGLRRFDGVRWQRLDSGQTSIACLYPYKDKLLVAGRFRRIGDKDIANIALYDGENGSDFNRSDTVLGDEWAVYGVAEYKGHIYFTGNFNHNPTVHPEYSEIIRFDGKRWRDVGGGIQAGGLAEAGKMTVWRNDLYVTGIFLEHYGAPGNNIAKWDGQHWHRLGDGLTAGGNSGGLFGAIEYQGMLYAYGSFYYAGGINALNIARWDGTQWCSLSDSIGRGIFAADTYKGHLFLGGAFLAVNGDSAVARVAYLDRQPNTLDCGVNYADVNSDHTLTIYPNPTSAYLYINLIGATRVDVVDVVGRWLFSADAQTVPQGIYMGNLPSGNYILKITDDTGRTFFEKVTKL